MSGTGGDGRISGGAASAAWALYALHAALTVLCERYLVPMEPEGGEISDEQIMRFIECRSSSTEGPELAFDRKAQREGATDPPVILDLSDDEEDEDDEDDGKDQEE